VVCRCVVVLTLPGCLVDFCEVYPERCEELAETGGTESGGNGDGDGDGDGDGEPSCTEIGCDCDGSPGSCGEGLVCEDGACVLELCGNGLVDDVDEQCDDGNDVEGDGCDVDCSYTTLEVAAGGFQTCALIEGGRVRCWGEGAFGGLGYGNQSDIGDDETPSLAGDVALPVGALQLDVGFLFSCALFEDEGVRCWGSDDYGRTGYPMTPNLGDDEQLDNLPAIMLGGVSTQFAVGGAHTCSVLDSADVRCWGFNNSGQLGVGNTMDIGDDEHPFMGALVNVGPNDVVFVASGSEHSCAVTVANDLFCWGWNDRGQLGYGSILDIGDDESPAMAGPVDVAFTGLEMDATITGLALGTEHTCALFSTGDVGCWGANDVGQLGQLDYRRPQLHVRTFR
jgi:cysteine-rich repeat protein